MHTTSGWPTMLTDISKNGRCQVCQYTANAIWICETCGDEACVNCCFDDDGKAICAECLFKAGRQPVGGWPENSIFYEDNEDQVYDVIDSPISEDQILLARREIESHLTRLRRLEDDVSEGHLTLRQDQLLDWISTLEQVASRITNN